MQSIGIYQWIAAVSNCHAMAINEMIIKDIDVLTLADADWGVRFIDKPGALPVRSNVIA